MKDNGHFYIFLVGEEECYFDDEKFYNLEESISNLHLYRFHRPNLELGILVSDEDGFIACTLNDNFTQFLIERKVKLIEYEFTKYIKKPNKLIFDLINGGKLRASIFSSEIKGQLLFEDVTEKPIKKSIYYNKWGAKGRLNKMILDSVQLTWSGVPENGETIPLSFRQYLDKKKKKEGYLTSIIIAVIILAILIMMFGIMY
tara:strand:- start:4442 stop:5044 length:603 start_codon:yes stop_codon:yes gene_type:complete